MKIKVFPFAKHLINESYKKVAWLPLSSIFSFRSVRYISIFSIFQENPCQIDHHHYKFTNSYINSYKFLYICTRRIGIMFNIHSRFSHFRKQDEIFLLSDLFEFVTPPFCFCYLSSLLDISNIYLRTIIT